MKLPVKQILSKNKKHYQIIDDTNKIIITDIPDIGDALIIVETLNLFNIDTFNLLKKEIENNKEWLSTTNNDEIECISIENLNSILNKVLNIK